MEYLILVVIGFCLAWNAIGIRRLHKDTCTLFRYDAESRSLTCVLAEKIKHQRAETDRMWDVCSCFEKHIKALEKETVAKESFIGVVEQRLDYPLDDREETETHDADND